MLNYSVSTYLPNDFVSFSFKFSDLNSNNSIVKCNCHFTLQTISINQEILAKP